MFQQDKLTNMRGKVLQVVRAYNTILADMNGGEKRLFHDKLRALDRQINGGVSKLSWSNKIGVEKFVTDALLSCQSLNSLVQRVKAAKKSLRRTCAEMGGQSLLKI